MADADFKVVGVVGRSNFHGACTEFHIHIFICDNRNFSAYKRKSNGFANVLSISFVLRVHGYRGITKESFGSCCGKLNIATAIGKGIAQMPEVACLILILNFSVRNGGFAVRAPVDYSFTTVDKTFLIKLTENFSYSFAAALIKSETFSVPVG